jgi:hypothetical protein
MKKRGGRVHAPVPLFFFFVIGLYTMIGAIIPNYAVGVDEMYQDYAAVSVAKNADALKNIRS